MKKLISFLLALVMMLTAVPALLAIAEDEAQTTPAFVIDGKLDEWYRDDDWAQENDCYFYYTMDDATLDPVSKKDGVSDVWLYEDVKVKIYVAYDDKYAYFYVDVLDPHIATEYDGSAYSQYIDNIDFYFDTDYLSCDGDFFTNCSNYEDADTHFRLVAHNLWIGDCKSEPKQIFEQEIVDNKIVDGVDTGEPNYNAVGYFRNSANTVPFQTFDDAGNLIGYGCDGFNSGFMVRIPEELKEYYINYDESNCLVIPHITSSIMKNADTNNTKYLDFKLFDKPIRVFGMFGYYIKDENGKAYVSYTPFKK